MIRAKLAVPAVFLTLGLFVSQNAISAQFTEGVINLRNYTLFPTFYVRAIRMDGDITKGDDATINEVIEKYQYKSLPVKLMVLNSTGGDVDEAYEMAETIANYGISTVIERHKSCNGTCFTLFVAGKNHFIYPESTIILGTAAVNGDTNNPEAIKTNEELLEFYKRSNVPMNIIKKFKRIQPGGTYQLSHNDMRSLDDMSLDFAPETKESIAAMKKDLAKIEKERKMMKSAADGVDELLGDLSPHKNKH